MRPGEGGRLVVVRGPPGRPPSDVTPGGFNARTRVHEYGGGAYAVDAGTVWFSNFADQRLYRQEVAGPAQPITPQAPLRYADAVIDRSRRRMICVRDDHTAVGREAVNTLVGLDLEGRGEARILAEGHDFYASPRLSPDGSQLAWLSWNHPNMPWDGTDLWLGAIGADGGVEGARRIAGGEGESIFQPAWSPGGSLYFVSDRSGWWNLYRWMGDHVQPVVRRAAEFGRPQWRFGMSTYAFAADQQLVCAIVENGVHRLVIIDAAAGTVETVPIPYTDVQPFVQAKGQDAFLVAGAADRPEAVVRVDLPTGRIEELGRASEIIIDPGFLSAPEPITFPTEGGRTAYAFHYPPRNREFAGPTGERPPLIVRSHGGPTGATGTAQDLNFQYFTSRWFALVDVNYGGSTGYGRAYRERLNGQWGIVDVDDCVHAARSLVERGLADPQRLAIAGGSAGGYTTLCALTFRDTFRAGANYFGLSELEAFVKDTHKFESRYLERLVAPYQERPERYRERSPIRFLDRLSCPVIVFQGLEDRIVPPNQSELIVDALRKKGLPVAYLSFAGEQHGFRQAATIQRCLEAELSFYAQVFGFRLGDPVEPVSIENLT